MGGAGQVDRPEAGGKGETHGQGIRGWCRLGDVMVVQGGPKCRQRQSRCSLLNVYCKNGLLTGTGRQNRQDQEHVDNTQEQSP